MRVVNISNAEYLKKPRPFTLSKQIDHAPLKLGFPQHLVRVGLQFKKLKYSDKQISAIMEKYGHGLQSLPYKGRYELRNEDIERCINNVLYKSNKRRRLSTQTMINILDGAIYHNFYTDEWNPGLRFLFASILTEYVIVSGTNFPLGFHELVRRNNMGWVTAQQYFQVLYYNTNIFNLVDARKRFIKANQYVINYDAIYKVMRSRDLNKSIVHPDLTNYVPVIF